MKFENNDRARLIENEVPYLSFPVLEQFPFIRGGFSTRLGGVSEGIYASMNLGYGRGDSDENVTKNYERISESMGIDPKTLVLSHQVHKTNLRVVTKEDCGKGIYKEKDYSEIDGLVTNEPNIALVTAYADCVPLLFVDPVNKAIATSHAGWRGTVAKIGPKTIETMSEFYGTNPEELIVVIGPSICQDCYEVSKDVIDEFEKVIPEKYQREVFPIQSEYYAKKGNNYNKLNDNLDDIEDKYQLNLWRANQILLMQAGMKKENIHISGVCTCCNSDLFHSHRASKGQRGSLSAFLTLV